ncbi:MAG: ATP-binding cassette domain-containing protein [Chlamydiales bacterium]|nr:ATP-binding cassette domain-containing protein [Chlamydiales bacterium]
MKPAIYVEGLFKAFSLRKSAPGIFGAFTSLFTAKTSQFQAVNTISFTVMPGQKVAFIGPNGAGKSTTIKMLTGILHPSSGIAEVLGLVPWQSRTKLAFEIGTVFGQRSQLWYHLPPLDTFNLLAKIYELPKSTYKARLNELIDIFELARLIDRPVRSLSLGERMRCELVASLLHKPKILFLDEPTIGLDLTAKLQIRELLNRLTIEHQTTLFLTSHDTLDIEKIADRVLVLDKGSIILDSTLEGLKSSYKDTSMEDIIQGVYDQNR